MKKNRSHIQARTTPIRTSERHSRSADLVPALRIKDFAPKLQAKLDRLFGKCVQKAIYNHAGFTTRTNLQLTALNEQMQIKGCAMYHGEHLE